MTRQWNGPSKRVVLLAVLVGLGASAVWAVTFASQLPRKHRVDTKQYSVDAVHLPNFTQPARLAIACLFRYRSMPRSDRWKDHKAIRLWLRRMEDTLWVPGIQVLLFHENCGCQEELQRQTLMNLTWVDVSRYFGRNESHSRPNPLCSNKTVVQPHTADWGYRAMCHWWFIDVWHHLHDFDFVLRFDVDCLVTELNHHPLALWQYWLSTEAFISPNRGRILDATSATVGLSDLAQDYANQHGLVHSPRPELPYTNVMGFRTDWAAQFSGFQRAVDESNCIFADRWGDLPLYGALLDLQDIPIANPCGLTYFHNSHHVEEEFALCPGLPQSSQYSSDQRVWVAVLLSLTAAVLGTLLGCFFQTWLSHQSGYAQLATRET